MEQDKKITYTVKHPGRLAVVLAASVGTILLAVAWTLYLDRLNRRTADLAAYTTLTRAAETVSASLDLDGLLLDLQLPDPRTDEAAAKNGAVQALLGMGLELSFTEEPDVMLITARVNERALRRQGVVLKERTWTQTAKVLPRTEAEPETQTSPEPVEHPKTVQTAGYLTGLLDEEGKGLNLRTVLERVRFERDRLSREIFGDGAAIRKLGAYFLVLPAGSAHRNCYRAVYALTDSSPGRTVGGCFFTVDALDLMYAPASGVTCERSESAMYDTAAEALDLSGEFAGATMYEIVGGSVVSAGRPSFDYNGFVRFVGLPMSYPLPDGTYWSPSRDPLLEDDLWRLVGNGEYTMAELLSFVRMEILARRGYTFPEPDQEMYRAHYGICGWYSPTEAAPERLMDQTERANLELIREIESLLDS